MNHQRPNNVHLFRAAHVRPAAQRPARRRTGLGVLLDTVTVDGVRSLVDQLMSDSAIPARVEDMRRMIHREGGSTFAADVVEEELAR